MNLIPAIPLEVRLTALFLLGACLGSLANLAAYRLTRYPRTIDPWSGGQGRRWFDRLPVVGWLTLRREAALDGKRSWIRPLIVELLCGAGLAWLYWWETERLGLFPAAVPRPAPPLLIPVLHAQFAVHVVLIWLMLVASLIDTDEKTIPDAITVPGTLIALLAAAVYPWSLLPHVMALPGQPVFFHFLTLTSPNPWPQWLGGAPEPWSLGVALGCWWLWCVAILPRTWYGRHGRRRALQLLLARLVRSRAARRIYVMGLVATAVIAAVWYFGGPRWIGLLSALVGMAASGGLVWMVRIVGTATLRREAMGFGDVTLMAMIGGFLGWQACLVVFFIAPFAGLVAGLLQLVLLRETEIPYGPFLCLAAVAVIARWTAIWDWTMGVFALGLFVPAVVIACMFLMAVLLLMLRPLMALLRGG